MIWVWRMILMRKRMRFEGVIEAMSFKLDLERDAEFKARC